MALERSTIPYVLSDYDGTIALTGETPVDGVDVNGAYYQAIETAINPEAAVAFQNNGGHRHRAPIEIVTALAEFTRSAGPNYFNRLAETVTAIKVDILTEQIGKPNSDGSKWPRPTDGFLEFWTDLENERRRRSIGSGVISAGHTAFIHRWFEFFDLEQPDVFSTAEVTDNIAPDRAIKERVKPAPMPLVLARAVLNDIYGEGNHPIYYVGDSVEKDGGLAAATGSDFTLIEPETSHHAWQTLASKLSLEVDAS